jgi:hypothetical protein
VHVCVCACVCVLHDVRSMVDIWGACLIVMILSLSRGFYGRMGTQLRSILDLRSMMMPVSSSGAGGALPVACIGGGGIPAIIRRRYVLGCSSLFDKIIEPSNSSEVP